MKAWQSEQALRDLVSHGTVPRHTMQTELSLPVGCQTCLKPAAVCLCNQTPRFATRRRVLILQHPQEQDFLLGSARLAALALPNSRIEVGLSWGSLSHAIREEAVARHWAVLYPNALPRVLTVAEKQWPCVIWDKRGQVTKASKIGGLVVLDGSWSQAKSLWWRNPWLLKLGRVIVHPQQPSIYGRLRRESQPGHVSTLESIGYALEGLGEGPEINVGLRRLFRTMMQRVRDTSSGRAQ